MALRIEDYALIGNCESAALVGRDGSIDWMALPRFDSHASFAALLGTPENGRWQIAPAVPVTRVTRRYREGTLVLETRFETEAGTVLLVDAMGRREGHGDVVRLVRAESGSVPMRVEIVLRPGYGTVVPWVSRLADGRVAAVAGPDRYVLDTTVPLRGQDFRTLGEFTAEEGADTAFTLTWSPSFHPVPQAVDPAQIIELVTEDWTDWARSHRTETAGDWVEVVQRSLITLKALTHYETGGIVAAPTTSLPEQLGGPRNWDYRYCWLRDATLTLYALLTSGFLEEASAWRDWLIRAIAGSPDQMQIMYGIAGERRLEEYEVPWLAGYEGSTPVRIGNAAAGQLQLDVYGEVLDAMYQARRLGLAPDDNGWNLERALVGHLETIWQQPDEGIWEVRGGRKHFTASKVMVWAAFDRAIRSVEEYGLAGPVDRWRGVRDQVHREVCERGFSAEKGCFTQYYGGTSLDASLLLMAMVGFLPADDPRVVATVKAIEDHLLEDGFVKRYDETGNVDGLAGGHEGAFLPCSFWLADNYVLMGRLDEARALFERLIALRNDVGLLSEEYDSVAKRQVGNFPQAFTHVALINTAHNLSREFGPAQHRAESKETGAAVS
ncbi:glycoside hydrolase family 15 protein [Lichenibacterium ramalinae]|uniref:Trehalase n=1 Tax=Lichenibacterium ramalinae TaxID=2316527 RepID=A0A4Q2R9C9_9HYPH|nr:glycoside hydrolase family 15 protein [Lichenibacterium ramalinae]RYB02505.1 glycoside hydrolase family 15 protein [Lichenibacterium ramalinae]